MNSTDDNNNEPTEAAKAVDAAEVKAEAETQSRGPARHLSGGLGAFSRGRRRKIRASSRRMSALWRVMSVTAAGALLVSGLSAVAFAVNSSTKSGSSAARAAGTVDETNLSPNLLGANYWASTPTTPSSYSSGSIGQLASVPQLNGSLPLDNNTLYWSDEASSGGPDQYVEGSYQTDTDGNISTNFQVPDVTINQSTENPGFTATSLGTLAADSNLGVFYSWSRNQVGSVGTINGGSTPDSSEYMPVWEWPATTTTTSTVSPNRVLFVPYPRYGSGQQAGITAPNSFADSWAGGEVDQNNGFLYFSGGDGSLLNSSFEMMIVNPADGKYNISGLIQPASGSRPIGETGVVASDMTIDAQGNAYLVVSEGPDAVPPSGGAAVSTSYLVKVEPGPTGGWTYSLVTPLWYYSNGTYYTMNGINAYGMGFLNGSIYANFTGSRASGYATLDKLNPLTGIVTPVAGGPGNISTQVNDLASPQSAAVLTGTVYSDVNKNGVQDPGDSPEPGQTVVLSEGATGGTGTATAIGQQVTNGLGQYSFLLPTSPAGTSYYVRVAQPQVNGANAVQTGITTSNLDQNPTTANPANTAKLYSQGKPIASSTAPLQVPYVDPVASAAPTPTSPGVSGSLPTLPMYAGVVVQNTKDVTTVNFGVSSQGSYGNATSGYKATIANGGPQQVDGPQPDLFLGAKDGSYPNGVEPTGTDGVGAHIDTDDGVTLPVGDQAISPQGQLLAVNNPYTFNYTLSGPDATSTEAGSTPHVYAWLPAFAGSTTFDPAGVTGSDGELPFSSGIGGTPGTDGGILPGYLRVDASTSSFITANTPDNSNGAYAPPVGYTAPTGTTGQTWTSDGEVEDYLVGFANAVVRLQVTSDGLGTVKAPINYSYSLSNISLNSSSDGTITSSDTDTLTSTGAGTVTSTTPHAVTNAGAEVVVTPVAPNGEKLRSATLVNTITDATLASLTPNNPTTGAIIIPAADTVVGSDVTLQLTYSQDASAAASTWTINPTTIDDSGTQASQVTVKVNSAAGTPLAGQTVTIKATGGPAKGLTVDSTNTSAGTDNGDGTFTAHDNGDGTYTVDLVSENPGSYTISATVVGDSAQIPVEKSVSTDPVEYTQILTVSPDAAVAANSSFTVPDTPATVSDTTGTGVTVTVNTADEHGHASSGQVVLTVPAPAVFVGAPGDGHQITVTTGDGTAGTTVGVGTATITSSKVGPYQVTATMGGDKVNPTADTSTTPATAQDTAYFTAGSADNTAATSTWKLSPTPASVTADGNSTITGTVTVTDQFGNPVNGVPVTVDVPANTKAVKSDGTILADGTNTTPTVTIITHPDGTATIAYSSTTAGSYTVGAYLNSDGTKAIGSKLPLQFTAGPATASGSSFSVSPTTVTADGTASVPVTVTTADENGNPVAGTVTLTVDQKGGAQPVFISGNSTAPNTIDVTTSATTGTKIVYLTSTVSGNFTVSATLGGATVDPVTPATGDPVPNVAHFGAGIPVAGKSSYTFDTTSVPDDKTPITGTIFVGDQYGNPVPSETVSVSVPSIPGLVVTDGAGHVLTPDANGRVPVITGPDGTATIEFSSPNAGSGPTNAYVGTPGSPVLAPAQTLTFTAGPPVSANSSWTVAPTTGGANQAVGTGSFTVTVTLKDKTGALVTGQASNIVLAGTPSGLAVSPFTDKGNGTYTATVTSKIAGNYELTASIPDGPITDPQATQPVTFIAGPASLADSTFVVSQDPVIAGSGYQTAQVTVNDQYGNPVAGVPVSFSAAVGTANKGTAKLTPVGTAQANGDIPTDTSGHASVQVTANVADSYPITATVNGQQNLGTVASPVANPQPAVFSAGPASVGKVSIDSSNPAPASDATGTGHTVSALVTDAAGNPIAGVPVTFTVSPGAKSGSTSGILTATDSTGTVNTAVAVTAVTNPAGIATVVVTATKADTYTVTASSSNSDVTFDPATASAVFGPGAFDPSKSTLAVDTATVVADGNSTHTITATVVDSYGNPIPNENVVFSRADGSMTLASPSTLPTGADGTAVITATDTVAETAHVTATVDGQGLSGSPAPVPFAAGLPDAANSSVTASPTTQVADGTSTITLKATIKDAKGNLLANVPVNFSVTGKAVLSDNGATTDGSGVATVTVTDKTAEDVTYTATFGPNDTPTTIPGSGQTLSFTAGSGDPDNSIETIDSVTATANGTDTRTATATIKDANGNPVEGQMVTFSIVPGSGVGSLNGSTQPQSVPTDKNGVATVAVTSTAVGSVDVAATIKVTGIDTPIHNSPVPASFVRENPATGATGASTLKVDNSNLVSVDNGSHIVTATVVGETTGNPLSGVPVTFTAPDGTSLNGNDSPAVVLSGADGTAQVTVTSTTPGQIPIGATVTVGGNPEPLNPATVNANFAAGAPDNNSNGQFSTVTISSGPKLADGQDYYTVTATLKDQYGNAIPTATVTFSPTPTTGVTVTPTTASTDKNGVATATVASTEIGTVLINASDSTGTIPGSPLPARFTAGNAASGTLAIDNTDAVTADGSAFHTITATVLDAGKNPVIGGAVTFTVPAGLTLSQAGTALTGTPGTGNTVQYTATTDADGTIVLTATTTKAGSYQVNASATASGGSITLTGSPVAAVFAAGPPDASAGNTTTTWVVTPGGTVPGDGSTPYTGTVTVTDANGNPVASVPVTVDVPDGVTASVDGTPLAVTNGKATIITHPDGTAVVQYTSTKPGKYQVGAYLPDGTQIGSKAPLEFVSTDPVAGNSSWIVTPDTSQTADGKSAFTATITLHDANNNLVTGQAKNLTITSDSTTGLIISAIKDNNDGTYTATVTSTHAATYKLSAYLNGTDQIGATDPVTFVAGPYSANASTLVVTNASVLANNKDTQTATATITDANGNPLAGQTVTFSVGAGKNAAKSAASLTSATQTTPAASVTATTGPDGTASVSVQASYADSYPVSAAVGNSQVSGSPADATFLAGVPSLGTLKIDSATGVTADGTTTHTVTATVTDADGNPLSGVNVSFTADKDATVVAGDPSATTASAQTNSSGVVTAYVTSTTVGSYAVTATAGTAPATVAFSPASVNAVFVAGPPSPGPGPSGKSTLTIDSNTVLADGTQYHTVTATVLDANGNPIGNQPVYFTVTNGSAQLSTASGLTNADGVITTQVTSTTAGSATIAATLGSATGTNVDTPVTATFTETAPSPTSSTFEVTTTGAVANGTAQNSATVTIEDGQGHPIAGVPLTFTITGGSDITQLPTFTTAPTTDASGQYVLYLTSKIAGTVTVSASYSVGGTSTTIKGQPQLTFVAGPVVAGSSTISVDTNTVLANGNDTHTVTVTALDANGNPVSGAPVQFTIAGGTAAASATLSSTTPVTTGRDGTAVVKVSSTAVGTVQVGATIGGATVGSGQVSMSFVVGVPFTGNSTLTVDTPDGVTANGTATHTITATARDSSNAPLAGEVVNFSAPQGTLSSSTATTDANGVARVTITSTTATSIPVTATVTTAGQTVVFTPISVQALFVAGPVDGSSTNTSTLTISNGPKLANGTDVYTVTATLKDANGNVIPDQVVNFTGSQNAILSGGTGTSQTTTATTNSSGVATITVASNVVGASTVSASAQGVALFGSPVTAQFGAGTVNLSKSSLAIDNSNTVVADGNATHTVTATLLDTNGAPVAGATVNFVNSGGTLSASSGVSDANGQVVVTITSKVPGPITISGSVAGTTGSLPGSPVTANFGAGNPDVGPNGTSTLTVTAGSVLNDGKATQSATGTILDANSIPVPGQSVVFTVGAPAQFSNGTQTITASTGATNGAPAVVTITSTQAGTFSVTATLGGVALKGSPASVSFASSGVADPTKSTFTVNPVGPISADGTAAYTATVTANDSNGTPVPGQVINFTVPAGLTGPTQATTNASGVATASYTSTTAATYPLTANIGSTAIGTKNLAFTTPSGRPPAPILNPSNGKTATGSGVPGDTITITDSTGAVIGAGTAAGDGSFSIPLTPNQPDGSVIYAYDTNPAGAKSDGTPATVTVVQIPAPVLNPTDGSVVTGTAKPGTTVTITAPGANGNPVVLCTAQANATTGAFSCVPLPRPGTGTVLSGTASDAAGNVSPPGTVTVQTSPSRPATPTVDPTNGKTVTGKADPNMNITVTAPGQGGNPVVLCTTTSDSQGNYSCNPQPVPGDGTVLSVTATDPTTGLTSLPGTGTVDAKKPAPPVVDPTDGSKVTGTAEPGDEVKVKDPNGNVICTTTADPTTGAFSCSPLNPKPNPGDVLSVTATDPAGNESDPTPVTVQSPVAAPVITVPANGSTIPTTTTPISGTSTPGTTVTVLDETNRNVCTATTNASGAWSCATATFTVGKHTLIATAQDSLGNVSPQSAPDVFTVAQNPLTVVSPTTGSTTANQTPTFTGTGTPGDPIQITSAGSTVCTTTVSSTGSWTCTLPAQPAGTATYTVTDTTTKESVPITLTTIAVDRIEGPDRYSTAAAAAAAAFPNGASTVIVAKGTNFPDAMSAVPAANHLNAPILLTQTPNVPAATMNELNALQPSKIIVLGDIYSVSAAAFNQMAGGVTSKPTMVRIGGIDRYATSRMLNQYVWGSSSTIFVSTGQSFTDADAAGPAAAKSDVPLLLVNGNLSMDSATSAFIRSFGVSTIHAIGNTSTLGAAVYSGISGLAATDRVQGSDPDQTAVAVAQAYWNTSSQVFIARDDDFADSLTGGATAAHVGAPVLLTNTQSLSPNVAAEVVSLKATQVHVMGDPNSITASTYNTLVSALSQ